MREREAILYNIYTYHNKIIFEMKALEKIKKLRNLPQGIRDITPKQTLIAQTHFYFWMVVGLIITLGTFIYSLYIQWTWRSFGFAIFIGAMIPLQLMQFVTIRKQLKNIRELDAITDEATAKIIKSMKGD